MASIKKRPDGRWRARYRDPSGKEHAAHFRRLTDAQQWLDAETASLVRGDWVDPRARDVTYQQWVSDWRASQLWRPRTNDTAEYALRPSLKQFGRHPLRAITTTQVRAWVRALSQERQPGGVRLCFQYLNSTLEAAVVDGLLARNPCTGVRLPTAEKEPITPLTIEDVQRLADAMPGRYRAIIVVGAEAGLRPSEARALTVDRVDWLRRELLIDRQIDKAGRFVPLKSKSARRTVPASDTMLEALSAHLARYPSRYGFVFETMDGMPLRNHRLQVVVQQAAKKAELGGVRFHDLRHAFASRLINAGVSVTAVQKALGHSSPKITLSTYAHWFPEADSDIRRALADSSRTAGEPEAANR